MGANLKRTIASKKYFFKSFEVYIKKYRWIGNLLLGIQLETLTNTAAPTSDYNIKGDVVHFIIFAKCLEIDCEIRYF